MPYIKAKDGGDIYYEVFGEGTPFLFLSETACDGAVWKIYQVSEFARDHRRSLPEPAQPNMREGSHLWQFWNRSKLLFGHDWDHSQGPRQ